MDCKSERVAVNVGLRGSRVAIKSLLGRFTSRRVAVEAPHGMDAFKGMRADYCKIVWRCCQGERAAVNHGRDGLKAKELGCCRIMLGALKVKELLLNGLVAENHVGAVKFVCGL